MIASVRPTGPFGDVTPFSADLFRAYTPPRAGAD